MTTENDGLIRSSLPAPPTQPSLVVQTLRHAAADPGRPAIVDGATDERLSRADLADRSAALATGLARRGIGRGDIVALSMPNLAWWPAAALGVWRAGAVIAPLSPLWTAEETARLIALVRPRLALAAGPLVPVLQRALSAAGVDAEVFAHGEAEDAESLEGLLASGREDPAAPRLVPGDLAIVPFSSGIGGLPKAVRLTHGNITGAAAQAVKSLAIDADSVVLAAAPVFHAMGLVSSICAPLSVGAQIVTVPAPKSEPILDRIAEHKVTHATIPPSVVAEFASDPGTERRGISSLEFVVTGGAHVPESDQLRAGERLHCPSVRQAYGMTEALVISGPRARPSEPGTVGWLAPGTEARLVDPESGLDVASGEPGELWIRGPQVMEGYYDDPDATATTVTTDGWLRTGDLVSIREDGQVVIEDRLKDLIKVKGASVAPAELELVLREHASVRDAAVVGRPDAERGEVPVAYVVPEGPATPDELISFVNLRVARYKRLHAMHIVDELPRMPNGKLTRRELRDRERAAAGSG